MNLPQAIEQATALTFPAFLTDDNQRNAERLKNEDLPMDVVYMASVQEELGCRGAIAGAFSAAPDWCIALDVTHAETPDAKEVLAANGIKSGWMTVPRMDGLGRYEGIERSAYNMFMSLPRTSFPDVFLFWDDFVAQGALTAFLGRGLRIPGDIKVVSLANRGLGPVYSESLTRFECDAAEAGEKVAAFALALLAKGRLPPPPAITPHYVFGRTFPY